MRGVWVLGAAKGVLFLLIGNVMMGVCSKVATSRRRMQESGGGCVTGNPIDDCWRCAGTDWRQDRQRLADCGIGFGRNALGGKGGPVYVVTDSSDRDAVSPVPGTPRSRKARCGSCSRRT
jgi:pectate lyase